jgi:hypothetical protein
MGTPPPVSPPRPAPHCRFVLSSIHLIPDSRRDSVPLFPKRQPTHQLRLVHHGVCRRRPPRGIRGVLVPRVTHPPRERNTAQRTSAITRTFHYESFTMGGTDFVLGGWPGCPDGVPPRLPVCAEARLPGGARGRGGTGGRARSHCRFAPPLTHFIPDSPTSSVPLFLKRQCDRTQEARAADAAAEEAARQAAAPPVLELAPNRL